MPCDPIMAPTSPWMPRPALPDPVSSPRAAAALSSVFLSSISARSSSVRRIVSAVVDGTGCVVGAGVDCANDAVDQQEAPAARASAIGTARKYCGVKWVIPPYRPDKPDRKGNEAGNHARLRYGAREPGPRFCQRAWTCGRVIQFLGNRRFIRQVSGRHPGSRSYRRAGCHWSSHLGHNYRSSARGRRPGDR